MSIKSRFIYGTLIAVIVIMPVVFFSSGFFAMSSEKVISGIEVMGVDLGGVNKAEGVARLAELDKTLRATRVTLQCQDRSWPLLLNEVGFDLNEEAVMKAALNVGKQGSPIRRWQDRKQFEKTGISLQPVFGFDREKLSMRVKELAREITSEPRDAALKINGDDKVTIVPSLDGVSVDLDRLGKDISDVLLVGKKPGVELSLVPAAPARTTANIESMGVKGLLGSYSTTFNPGMVSRTYNISVAAKALDELLVQPGQVVSFNEVVGPRSSEAGYKTAPVIVNNELVDGLGGGVCQVSTTLYNSVLLANLELVYRSSHSLPVSYVPIGRDATVVYEAIDFKFRNNTDSYLYIKSFVGGGQISIKIYGNTAYKRDVSINSWVTVVIEPNVVNENDPNLPKGEEVVKQEGSRGYRAAAERVVMLNGAVEKRETLSSSDYSAVNKIIAVGTAEHASKVEPIKQTPTGGQQNKTPAVTKGDAVAGQAGQQPGVINPGTGGGANTNINPAIPGKPSTTGISAPGSGGNGAL